MSDSDLKALVEILEQLKNVSDQKAIGQALDNRFDGTIKQIFDNWQSKNEISELDSRFLDLYSQLQLSFVEHFYLRQHLPGETEDLVQILRRTLFQMKRINLLKDVVTYVCEEQKSRGESTENDRVFIYLMRMLDARTLAYRLCFKELNPPPNELNEMLIACLLHHDAKAYLYNFKDYSQNRSKVDSLDQLLSYRHQFFIGCCTFAVALFEKNLNLFDDSNYQKYIYLLAKYIRVALSYSEFMKNPAFLYCLRGIFASLTNCVPTSKWIHIINSGLKKAADADAQRANPFNTNLFSLVLDRLLNNETLSRIAVESKLCLETSLIDIALIFINKWSDTNTDLNNDRDAYEETISNQDNLAVNQVNVFLRTNFDGVSRISIAKILFPFVDSNFDRLRLMSLVTLSNVISLRDFHALNDQDKTANDWIKLICEFINQADQNTVHEYRGIPFERLLRYLFRFLIQDFNKKQTINYVSQLVRFARNYHFYALKILRRLSSAPELREKLIENPDLKNFVNNQGKILYESNDRMKTIFDRIQQNLSVPAENEAQISLLSRKSNRRPFISYSQFDCENYRMFVAKLKQSNIFNDEDLNEETLRKAMLDTSENSMNESSHVFILLSESFCASEYCRDQWTSAIRKKKIIYPILLDRNFTQNDCDWVTSNINTNTCFELYEEEKMERLMKSLVSQYRRPAALYQIVKGSEESLDSKRSTRSARPRKITSRRSYEHKLIVDWDCEDVRHWCHDKNLNVWIPVLNNYQGVGLIELKKLLSRKNGDLTLISKSSKQTLFDLPMLKVELERAISQYGGGRLCRSRPRSVKLSPVKSIEKRKKNVT